MTAGGGVRRAHLEEFVADVHEGPGLDRIRHGLLVQVMAAQLTYYIINILPDLFGSSTRLYRYTTSWKHRKSLSSPRLLNSEGSTGHFPLAPFISSNGGWVQKLSGVGSNPL